MHLRISKWTQLVIRIIAAGGLVYEILVDKLKNPTALVVFGGLAGVPDVLNYRQQVRSQVEREVELGKREEKEREHA